jgi:hypothetical protein
LSKRAFSTFIGGSSRRLSLDDEELGEFRIPLRAVGQFSRQAGGVESSLSTGQLAGLPRRLPRSGSLDTLSNDLSSNGRILFEEGSQLDVDYLLDPTPDLGRNQLVLGLTRELRIADLDRDDRRQALPHIIAGEILLQVLEQTRRVCIAVDRSGECGPESGEMGTSIAVVDRICETEYLFLVTVVPLQRYFDRFVSRFLAAHFFEMDGLLVQGSAIPIEVIDKTPDSARIREGGGLVGPLVAQIDAHPSIEEGQLPQTLGQGLVMELQAAEDLRIGPEMDSGSALFRLADGFDRLFGKSPNIGLKPDLAFPLDLQLQLLGKGIHHGHAYAV